LCNNSVKKKKKIPESGSTFFLFRKKPNKSNKIRHHKTAKNKFKLGRKKKANNKTPPTLKQNKSNQIRSALLYKNSETYCQNHGRA
jgi:hypothetical protein